MKTSLYRHYDCRANILYIGISHNFSNRLDQHEQASEWYDQIAWVKVEHYESREQALIAEKKAILDEKPPFNMIHNGNSTVRIKQKRAGITEDDIINYPLVVSEREKILDYYNKRWGVRWIADHFGTTPEVVQYVLKKQHVFVRIPSEVSYAESR